MVLWRWLRPYLSIFMRFMHISYLEARTQYYGARLGILWLPLSTLIFTAMLALVFHHSDIMSIGSFFLYVLSGYILWQFIQGSIGGSTEIIQRKLEFAIHNDLSLPGLFGKLLIDRLFEFFINLLLLIASIVFIKFQCINFGLLLFLPFLALIMVTSIAVAYLVNLATMLYPDLATLIKTGTRFVFFASPIFWTSVDGTGIRHLLATYNPVSYYLAMFRHCLGIESFVMSIWLVGFAISALVCVAGVTVYERTKNLVRNIK